HAKLKPKLRLFAADQFRYQQTSFAGAACSALEFSAFRSLSHFGQPLERRRRDKINNWIVQLSKILPDSVTENSKTGQSKGGILSKACDYIQELRQTQQQLVDNIKETERLHMDNELLRQQVEELRNKNSMLRAHLQQNGITVMVSSPGQ
ncbi:unnamed protein product, partial [Lampetra fluviatilis]